MGGDVLRADSFLAEILGRPAYSLDWPQGADTAQRIAAALRGLPGQHFVYAKTSPEHCAHLHILEELGFRLTDTTVRLRKELDPGARQPLDARVRPARPADSEAVAAIAASSFRFSRFHLDPRIPRAQADLIKARWAGNFFKGLRGDSMLVAEQAGEVAGFNLILFAAGGAAIVDLIAVAPKHQRRGLGRALLRATETARDGLKAIKLGTQLANLQSLAFYQSEGFQLVSAEHVLHHHGADAP